MPLLQALDSASVIPLRNVSPSTTAKYPYLEMRLRGCPLCRSSDFQIATRVIWEDIARDLNGEKKTERTKEWLKVMVPAELGVQLQEILFGKAANSESSPQSKSAHEGRENALDTRAAPSPQNVAIEQHCEQMKSHMSEGLHLFSEQVILDGELKTVEATADSTETAYAKAESKIPADASVLERKEVYAPVSQVITIEGFDEHVARDGVIKGAQMEFFRTPRIKTFKLVTAGKKGVKGNLETPNLYEFEILLPATVKITYKTKARADSALIDGLESSL